MQDVKNAIEQIYFASRSGITASAGDVRKRAAQPRASLRSPFCRF